MKNPFSFGTLVDKPYFTDRVKELQYIVQFLDSENHLILISPRRYGKSSLVRKAVGETGRPYIWLNMQTVLSKEDFAAKLLKLVLREYKIERIKHLLRHFRVIPTISLNPASSEINISFQSSLDTTVLLEDVFALLEKVSTPDEELIVVFDEFQDILGVERGIDKILRAIMQEQKGLNYIFLGSQESMMSEIFERVHSPFYHFGMLMRIDKIPYDDFLAFVAERFSNVADEPESLSRSILEFTACHPYYTQQLASEVWSLTAYEKVRENVVEMAVGNIVKVHDLDYERLWLTFNKTDQFVLSVVCKGENPVQLRQYPTSTITSSLTRLMKRGVLVKGDGYEIEDPFLSRWIHAHQR
uniref:ATP-binding protein n=1 Tax=Prevotella sp. GTC17253 TaxID=3236793 RepID=A0AB33IPP1_9BACT